jgi:hypothetical protein
MQCSHKAEYKRKLSWILRLFMKALCALDTIPMSSLYNLVANNFEISLASECIKLISMKSPKPIASTLFGRRMI